RPFLYAGAALLGNDTLSLHDALPIFKEMTRKVSAEVDLVHQQTQNQRYGSSHIGATAKDISNVVTDAASGVVDIRNILSSSANRSEERFSRNAETEIVCRLLLDKENS